VTDLLSVEDVHLGYGRRAVLKGVTLRVRAGEVVALIGPNGAGKTSLLKTLAGLVVPGKGRVHVAAERSRSVSYLAQGEELPLYFTAREIVELGRLPYVGMWRDFGEDDERAITRAMQRTATSELADRKVGALSGGERQRVALARAIAQEPKVLLLDEPTTHLDLRHQVELFASLREEARSGTAVVAVMHDLTFAAQADRCVLLADGTVRADGPPADALQPEALADVYGTPIEVMRASDGSIAALVARPRT
jgi:iron complex transport system ATP-binding protein